MPVEIKQVRTRKALKQFVCFPYKLYRNSRYWVPPLIRGELETLSRKTNPSYDHCEAMLLLAKKNGRLAGRIAGILNHRYMEQSGKKDARFCWFDVVDDPEVTRALFSAVETWAKAAGAERLVGPMGFTTFDRQGILVKGFEEMPTFAGVHNHAYYSEHLEAIGYRKEIEYVEFELKVPGQVPDKITRIRDVASERYHLRLLNVGTTREMLPYADSVFRVINAAYKPLYGFTELTERQIAYFVKKYFSFIKPDYTSAVLNEKEQVVAFQISMPSLSHALKKARGRLFPFGWYYLKKAMARPDRLDMLLTGVIPEYQNKGVNAIFMSHLTGAAIENGIRVAESNNELEENFKVQNTWRYFESRQHRRSRLYSRVLS